MLLANEYSVKNIMICLSGIVAIFTPNIKVRQSQMITFFIINMIVQLSNEHGDRVCLLFTGTLIKKWSKSTEKIKPHYTCNTKNKRKHKESLQKNLKMSSIYRLLWSVTLGITLPVKVRSQNAIFHPIFNQYNQIKMIILQEKIIVT